MARRAFNWKFALLFLLILVGLALSAWGVHQWRRQHIAKQGLKRGLEAFSEQHWEDAAKYLAQYVARYKNDVPNLFMYAEAQMNIRPQKINQIKQAELSYRQILRLQGDHLEAARRVVEIYLSLSDASQAVQVARDCLAARDDARLRILLAMALIRRDKYPDAFGELLHTQQEFPDTMEAYGLLGQLTEYQPDQFPDHPAGYWFDLAVQTHPDSPTALIMRAGFHLRQGRPEAARSDAEAAAKKDLTDPAVPIKLARVFMDLDEWTTAESLLEQARQADPVQVDLWNSWARRARQGNNPDRLNRVAEDGIAAMGYRKWDFLITATELFLLADNRERARECIDQFKQQDIQLGVLEYFEGRIAQKEQSYYDAINHYRRALAMEYDAPEVRLNLSDMLAQTGETYSALKELQTQLDRNPHDLDTRLHLTQLLLRSEQIERAAEQARRLRQDAPNRSETMLLELRCRLALYLQRQTDPDAPELRDLQQELEELIKLNPQAVDIVLLQFQLAMQQQQLDRARLLLAEMKRLEASLLADRQGSESSLLPVVQAEAEWYGASNQPDQAARILQTAIKDHPQAASPVRALVSLWNRQNRQAEIVTLLQEAVGRISDPVVQRDLTILQATLYGQWNQPEAADRLLSEFAQKYPRDLLVKQRLLQLNLDAQNPQQAQHWLDQIRSVAGEDHRIVRLGQVRIWLASDEFARHYSQIVSLLRDNLREYPDDQDSRLLLAAAYARNGQTSLASATYWESYNRSPQNLSVIQSTLNALTLIGDFDRANELIAKADAHMRDDQTLLHLKLQNEWLQSRWSSALATLETLRKMDPENQTRYRIMEAYTRGKLGQFEQAEAILQPLYEAQGDSMSIVEAYINLKLEQNQTEQALAAATGFIERGPSGDAYLLRGRTYQRLKQPEAAEKDFLEAARREPKQLDGLLALANLYSLYGRWGQAVDASQKLLALEPDDPQLQKIALSILLSSPQADHRQQGHALLAQALQRLPDDPQLLYLQAQSLLETQTKSRWQQAMQILENLTKQNPNFPPAWTRLVELTLQQNQARAAVNLAAAGLNYAQQSKELYILKARAEQQFSLATALQTLETLQAKHPQDAQVLFLLVDAHLRAGQAQAAVDLLEKNRPWLQQAGPVNYRIVRAAATYKLGQTDQALQELDALAREHPDDINPLASQVRLLRDAGQWTALQARLSGWSDSHPQALRLLLTIAAELMTQTDPQALETAEKALQLVLQRDEKNLAGLLQMALLLQSTNRSEPAAQMYRRALAVHPKNYIACNNLAWILCEQGAPFDEAMHWVQEGLAAAPEDYLDIIDTRGVIHLRKGEIPQAIEDFRRCIQLFPDHAPGLTGAYYHLGQALARLDRREQALQNLRQALTHQETYGGLGPDERQNAERLLESLTQKEKET